MDTCYPRSCMDIQTHCRWTLTSSYKDSWEHTTFLNRRLQPKILWIESTGCRATFSKNSHPRSDYWLVLKLPSHFVHSLSLKILPESEFSVGCFLFDLCWQVLFGVFPVCIVIFCWKVTFIRTLWEFSRLVLEKTSSRENLFTSYQGPGTPPTQVNVKLAACSLFINMRIVWTQATKWHKDWPLATCSQRCSFLQSEPRQVRQVSLLSAFEGKNYFSNSPSFEGKTLQGS